MDMLLLASLLVASLFQYGSAAGITCVICSSTDPSSGNATDLAYRIRPSNLENTNVTKQDFTIADFYKGNDCGNSISTDTIGKLKTGQCELGCIKILSNTIDRGNTISDRVTRQCAYGDPDTVSKYFGGAGFKRTGSGSDKVNNWFYYCNGDKCNSSPVLVPLGLGWSTLLAIAVVFSIQFRR